MRRNEREKEREIYRWANTYCRKSGMWQNTFRRRESRVFNRVPTILLQPVNCFADDVYVSQIQRDLEENTTMTDPHVRNEQSFVALYLPSDLQ